jgi:hypothetical protein
VEAVVAGELGVKRRGEEVPLARGNGRAVGKAGQDPDSRPGLSKDRELEDARKGRDRAYFVTRWPAPGGTYGFCCPC